ncbi:hypothetical protein IGI04_040483 [Brassica rapa subsp. trilocularis]|uniref:Uncharacterized protein n=1 Tax=Brassica rapa subsp. trilocularis TaxID=1813537 RepID=A0ABQ7KNR7_BRACM|nr:hypothetical protein IGI04_040483 [Brassica rapa subsp. trilocularis]
MSRGSVSIDVCDGVSIGPRNGVVSPNVEQVQKKTLRSLIQIVHGAASLLTWSMYIEEGEVPSEQVKVLYVAAWDGGCRSMEDECLWSTVVSEYRSTGLVSGSTVVEQNRATNGCCCQSMRSALLCGLNAPNLQYLVRIVVGFPCCF